MMGVQFCDACGNLLPESREGRLSCKVCETVTESMLRNSRLFEGRGSFTDYK